MANSASSIGVSCEPELAGRVPTVAAVIVTYNRKELLGRCLEAVLGQSRPVDKVIVVDNCSSDGTAEFLRERSFLEDRRMDYLRLSENGGSAGGFHEGMKRAYERGFDWIWVMDDDGMPFLDTLAQLLGCPGHVLFRGCLVLSNEDSSGDQLAFALETPWGVIRRRSELENVRGRRELLEGFANPFNGLLMSRVVIETVGLPKKELFIWGDEAEYFLRAKRACVPIGTVLGAVFLHPPDRMLARRVRLGIGTFTLAYSEDPYRFFLIVRNCTYIALRYNGLLSATFLKLVAYPLLFPHRAGLILRAWREGLSGRLGRPEEDWLLLPHRGQSA